MPRPTRQNDAAPGHDSFLDIVANMVGILIILVMVIGVRVKHTPVVASIPNANAEDVAELQRDSELERSLRGDVLRASEEIDDLQREAALHGRQRDLLATAVASVEHELNTRRQQMGAESQAAFDLQRSVAESRAHLDQLIRARLQAEATRAEPTVVESYPTPLSRTVNGRQAHFQLLGGLIAPIPFDQLIGKLRGQLRQRGRELLEQRELTDTLGPIGGFRLRYTLRRHDISPEMAAEIGYGGSMVRMERAEFLPDAGRMGEPIDAALAEGSEFRQTLANYHPGRSAVTVWTYADSFGSFRKLKKELYRMGYMVAGRPLPMGVPIAASPDGTKSAAE